MAYRSINPKDGKRLERFERISDARLDAALAAAETCVQTWKHKSCAERTVVVIEAVRCFTSMSDGQISNQAR